MKNWLRNTLIAGSVLLGSLGNVRGQSVDDVVLKSLQGDWKSYKTEINEIPVRNKPVEQPVIYSNTNDSAFMDFIDNGEWKEYETQINEAPVYNSTDSVKNYELPSFKEAKKKLGIESISELKNLGYGYVTSKKEFARIGEEGNYETLIKLYGELSEKDLRNIDDGDKIITSEEIFNDYASKQLGVSKDEIVNVGNGYVTSKNLEMKLGSLSRDYENHFEKPRETLYEKMGKDKVLTEDEIYKTEKVLSKYL